MAGRKATRGRAEKRPEMSGRVVRAEDGAPIEGAEVRVSIAPCELEPDRVRSFVTGADGRFDLSAMPWPRNCASVWVQVRAPGRATALHGLARRRAREAAADAAVTIALGPGGVIRGRVSSATRAGGDLRVGAGRVTAYRSVGSTHPAARVVSGGRPAGWFRAVSPLHSPVAADGTFELDGVPAGRLLAVGVASGDVCLLPVRFVRAPAEDVALEVAAPAERTYRILDEDGRPVRGAVVQGTPHARADRNGIARVTPNAAYLCLLVTASGYGDAEVSIRAEDALHADATPVDVRLARVVPAAISGRVTDSSGAAVARARVECWAFDAPAGEVRRVVTSRDGTFAAPAAARGRWQVSAARRGYAIDIVEIRAPASGIELRLRRMARVVARLVRRDGLPVPRRVQVIAPRCITRHPSGCESVTGLPAKCAARAGRISVAVAPGRSGLGIWAPGLRVAEIDIDVAEGAVADLGDIELTADPLAKPPEWAQPE